MKLTLQERFTILKILPVEVNFVTLKIVRDVQDSLAVSEKETKEWQVEEVRLEGGQVATRWNEKGSKAKTDLAIGARASEVIAEALEELDKAKKLTNEHFTIYEKFVVEKK